MIELKRELHWKWSRNGLLNGICKMQPWDDYSFFPLTSIESALRSKSYPIKLIWKCSKSIQWPNFFGNISPTKYGWSPQDQESSSELKTKFLIKHHSKQFSPTKILHLQSQLSLKTLLKIYENSGKSKTAKGKYISMIVLGSAPPVGLTCLSNSYLTLAKPPTSLLLPIFLHLDLLPRHNNYKWQDRWKREKQKRRKVANRRQRGLEHWTTECALKFFWSKM